MNAMECYTEMRKNRVYKQVSYRHRQHLVNTARLNGTYCIMTFTKAQKQAKLMHRVRGQNSKCL